MIPRDDSEEKWNCELFHTKVTVAHALKELGAGTVARAFSVCVPVLRNTRDILPNEEIVLKWPRPKETARPKQKNDVAGRRPETRQSREEAANWCVIGSPTGPPPFAIAEHSGGRRGVASVRAGGAPAIAGIVALQVWARGGAPAIVGRPG